MPERTVMGIEFAQVRGRIVGGGVGGRVGGSVVGGDVGERVVGGGVGGRVGGSVVGGGVGGRVGGRVVNGAVGGKVGGGSFRGAVGGLVGEMGGRSVGGIVCRCKMGGVHPPFLFAAPAHLLAFWAPCFFGRRCLKFVEIVGSSSIMAVLGPPSWLVGIHRSLRTCLR